MADKNRKTAYSVLWDVEQKGAYSNLALNHHIEREKPGNAPLVREIVYGVLENQIRLDWEIEPFLKQPLEKLGIAEKLLLRIGFWQLTLSETIPDYVAVNETVNLAKEVAKGRDGFINAVLRSFLRKRSEEASEMRNRAAGQDYFFRPVPDRETDCIRYLSVRYSARPWICEKWVSEYGAESAEEMLASSLKTPLLTIRPNRMKTTKAKLADLLREENSALSVTEGTLADNCLIVTGGSVLGTEAYRNGLFSVQEETSVLAAEMLDAKPGETVYDVCAAPGGKTLALAEIMDDKGILIACDVNGAKLGQIKKEKKRLGVSIPRILVRNAATGRTPESGLSATMPEVMLLPESADRVLVDAPCSGLGMLARKPEIKLREPDPNWENLPEKQLQILHESAKLLKKGGTLVYSTCTVSRTENEDVVRMFLESEPEFERVSDIQYTPAGEMTDGFYIAKLKRKGTL